MNTVYQTSKTRLARESGLDVVIPQAFDLMRSRQIDYADVYLQHAVHESWQLEEGRVKSGSFATSQGLGVRAVSGEKTAFAYANGLHKEVLLRSAQAVKSIGALGQSEAVQVSAPPLPTALYGMENSIESCSANEKITLLQKVDTLARAADKRVTQVMASLSVVHEWIYLLRLDGREHGDIRPLLRLSVTVIVEENGRREQGSFGGGGRYNMDYFSDELVQNHVDQAVAQAVLNLSSQAAPAGEMTVILGSGWPGVLLHEAVGHGLEGDFNRKGTSVFANRIGEKVAAEGVNVIDQGNIPYRRGSLSIDDEGNATQETVLIENGILRGYLQDETNARLMGQKVTGNGRRESYAHVPMPRMTNTFMSNGTHSAEEIIASVDKGLYAVNFGGGQVDITSGQFVFSASEAWWIENGRLQYPVKGATLIGNGAAVLQHVSMIGDDLALDSGIGVCGKEGQSVPVGVGQPTLRIDAGLTVGGSQV